jgi:hypothetical protein
VTVSENSAFVFGHSVIQKKAAITRTARPAISHELRALKVLLTSPRTAGSTPREADRSTTEALQPRNQ